MAQSDARFGYRAKMGREDHDLNQRFGFSTAPGMLNPIFTDFASPGDTYYIKHDLEFLRTAPLAAPAMVDVMVHYESFFVPMQMLYTPFDNTFSRLRSRLLLLSISHCCRIIISRFLIIIGILVT